MKQAIIVFTRIPTPGKTKTRLMPYFSGEECAEFHTALLQDLSETLRDALADIYVAYEASNPFEEPFYREEIRNLFPGAEYFEQEGEGLGQRMHHAMVEVLNRGYDRCILIGTDVPDARNEDFNRAFDLLTRNDFVFGPTEDGGYWLVGARSDSDERALLPIFSLEQYSTETVLEDTLAMIPSWKRYALLDEKSDIDTIEDLLLYRSVAKGNAAAFLEKHHIISVIVPVYNEVSTIHRFLDELEKLGRRCEVIFVDGGSTDGTKEILQDVIREEKCYRLISSPKGRGIQLNNGADVANGDVFFFLHADTELPMNPIQEINEVLETHVVGCFGVAFHSYNFFMWTNRVISNHRAKKGIVFGDQGMFLGRELFYDNGMFPEIPLMEDYQFSMDLQKKGILPGMTKSRLYTSDRRFSGGTIQKLRVMWLMNRLRKRYREGEPVEKLLEEYPDLR